MENFFDELELDDETPAERLARELAEADIRLMHDLRRARERKGLSQAQLGDLLGVSQASVSAFESGIDAKLSTIRRYAHALEVVISHSTRPNEEASAYTTSTSGFESSGIPTSRPKSVAPNYIAANSRRTDFAIAA